ncbi:MAG: PDZ domain-containing protein [Dehalococcoidia bacterium]|jgi:membrane-associated protease RseP (regulator of RpoE activity)
MKKFVVATGLAVAVIALLGGGLAFRALNGGGSSASALAASKDQQDIFSTLGSQQGATPTAETPWLGAQIALTADGLTVSAVIAGSPAEKAGLQRGDVIKAVDGTQVSDMQALLNALKNKKPGDSVTLSITRGGNAQDITATLEARPAPLPSANPILPELNGIPQDQLFSHIMGGSFQFKDSSNNSHTATVDLGTVTGVDTNAKTITADLNVGGSKTYTIGSGVTTVPTDLSQFQNGDNVVVLSVDGNLRLIAKNAGGLLQFLGKGGRGGMRGWQGFGMGGTKGEQNGLATPGASSGQKGLAMPGHAVASGVDYR